MFTLMHRLLCQIPFDWLAVLKALVAALRSTVMTAGGTVCDNDWDLTDAAVVCRQLGFYDAEEAKSGAFFGQGEGTISMDGVACDGSESKVTECPSHCWEQTKCERYLP